MQRVAALRLENYIATQARIIQELDRTEMSVSTTTI